MESEKAVVVTPSGPVTSTEADMDEGSSGERRSSNRIPYLPEEVVRHLVGYLPVSDLKACRLVSKTWNRAAVVVLNRRMEICIKSGDCSVEYWKTFRNSIEGVSLKVRSLHFHKELFEEIADAINDGFGDLKWTLSCLQELSKFVGEQVKKLTVTLNIRISIILGTVRTRKKIYSIICQTVLEHYPQVEELKLSLEIKFAHEYSDDDDDDDTSEEENDNEGQEENAVVEYSLPKLKSVTIGTGSLDESHFLDRPELRAFKDLPKSVLNSAKNLKTLVYESGYAYQDARELIQIPKQLETLHLRSEQQNHDRDELRAKDMTVLTQLRFSNLKSLHLENIAITWSNHNDEIVKSFLKHFADKLASLWIECYYSGGGNRTFPPDGLTLKQLKRFSLYTFEGKILWENLPALNELQFLNNTIISDNLHFSTLPTDWPITKFTYRTCTRSDSDLAGLYPSLALPQFPLWFSKLSSLTINFSQHTEIIEALPGIFHWCRQLKSLSVCNSVQLFRNTECTDLDACITGIPKCALERLKDKCPRKYVAVSRTSNKNIMKMIEVSKSTKTLAPNIGNLSELRELSLRGSFSDAAVLFGIVYCTKLRSLELVSLKLTKNAERIAKCGLPGVKDLSVEIMCTFGD